MIILPTDLKGRTIVDAYESNESELTLVFTDGAKVKLKFDGYFTVFSKADAKHPFNNNAQPYYKQPDLNLEL